MRGLNPREIEILRICDPSYTPCVELEDCDSIYLDALIERGLLHIEKGAYIDEDNSVWDLYHTTELGRLAVRVNT